MTSVGSAVLMIVLILLNLCLLKYLFHESRVKIWLTNSGYVQGASVFAHVFAIFRRLRSLVLNSTR